MSQERWSDLVGAYVLGAMDPDERAVFEARLSSDLELQKLVDQARASTLVLAESLPDEQIPPGIRERVLERARAGGRRAGGRTSPRGPRPTVVDGGRGRAHVAAPWLLLAASLVGLTWVGMEYADVSRASVRLEAQLDSVRQSLGEAQATVARFDALAQALTGPDVQFATLTGDVEPALRLVWNREQALLVVAARNLPPAPEGRTFQLWGIRGEEPPVSLGTFATDESGSALVTLTTQSAEYDVSALTEEPAGGSPQPTTTPFLVGAWTAS